LALTIRADFRADDDWREINAKLPKWLHSHPYNDMLGDGLPRTNAPGRSISG